MSLFQLTHTELPPAQEAAYKAAPAYFQWVHDLLPDSFETPRR